MPIILVGESLAELERHLEALKQLNAAKGAPAPAPKAVPKPDAQKLLNRKVRRLKQRATRTTGKVWDVVVAAAALPEGRGFTLADLAEAVGEKPSRVQSWHRILGRPTKRLGLTVFARVEGAERPTRFVVPAAVRKAVALAERGGGPGTHRGRSGKGPGAAPT